MSGAKGACLNVREVRFDDQGLGQDPPGPWQPFTGRIEGYAHTPGVRNVLRVDRYQRKQAAAGATAPDGRGRVFSVPRPAPPASAG